MAKQKSNMFGGFEAAAARREQEQRNLEAAVTGTPRKRGDSPTTITLTISQEDKIAVKTYAAKNNTTVSDLLHRWIGENCADSRGL